MLNFVKSICSISRSVNVSAYFVHSVNGSELLSFYTSSLEDEGIVLCFPLFLLIVSIVLSTTYFINVSQVLEYSLITQRVSAEHLGNTVLPSLHQSYLL